MITLLSGQNDNKTYRGRTFGGIRVTVTAVNNTTADALTQAEVLMQNLLVQAVLNRGGIEHQILSLTGDIVPACVFGEAYDYFDPSNTTNTAYQITTANAVGVAEIGQICFTIPFGSPIDCTSTGEIKLTAQVSSGFFASTLNQTLSNVTLDLEETFGAEIGLPRIITQPIQANDTNPSFNIGDGVRSLFFVNRDKGGILTSNQVISSVAVTSDEKMNIMNYNQLLAYRNKMFPNYALSAQRAQTFCLLPWNPEKVYFGVSVNASTIAANVTSSKNYWVAWVLNPSSRSVLAGKQYTEKTKKKLQAYICGDSQSA